MAVKDGSAFDKFGISEAKTGGKTNDSLRVNQKAGTP
jgi:hypothetical protein